MQPIEVVTKQIVKEMMNYKPTITFEARSVKEVSSILDIVLYESFVTFHVGEIRYFYNPFTHKAEIQPEYVYSQSEYHDWINKIMDKLRAIKKQLDKYPSELIKEKYIHDYLCKKVVYKEIGHESHCVLGPLFKGEGVCEGIAKTAQALFRIANLNAHIVCGDATDEKGTVGHAWNAVQINGSWHLVDITYDNTISDPDFIRYDYFNVSAQELSASHTPYTYCSTYFNMCTTSLTYFRLKNIEFKNERDVYNFLKNEVERQSTYIYFKYTDINNPLKIDDLVDYVLNLPKATNVNYSSDKQMGVYYLKVKYSLFY